MVNSRGTVLSVKIDYNLGGFPTAYDFNKLNAFMIICSSLQKRLCCSNFCNQMNEISLWKPLETFYFDLDSKMRPPQKILMNK